MITRNGDSRRDEIVRAALDLLDEEGLEAVSLRAVARRLGVRLNTVSWHVKTKARLRELMAEAIFAGISFDGLPDDWRDRTAELARRFRRALLAHRDGAFVVAGTFVAEPATLRAAEALVAALLDGGLEPRDAGWTCWTILYFTLGLTQEEQGAAGAVAGLLESAVTPDSHPALARVLPHLVDNEFTRRFEFGLDRILDTAARG